ncbi:MAG: LysR family transcriptional regulator [Alphaproteobacteria bacterium]|nr:MAG: LysR family transcriptional regulator [Alphaproteobacteria bacterium]
MEWDKLRTFYIVAEAGSFTHASERLNLSQSAISRQVQGLEDSMGFPLFHRHPRGLILTEQGETLHKTVSDVFVKLERTEAALKDSRSEEAGQLNVTTTVAFGSTWLVPHLRDFMEEHPAIKINLLLSDTEIDISMRESDVAIRFHAPHQADLIQRPLAMVNYHIYASQEYLDRKGNLTDVRDLDDHAIVSYGPEAPRPLRDLNWIINAGGAEPPRDPVLQVNNVYGLLQAVECGVGLAALPDYITQTNDRVVRVLPDLEGPQFQTYFVYPEELRNVKRIALFRDFLIAQVESAHFSE